MPMIVDNTVGTTVPTKTVDAPKKVVERPTEPEVNPYIAPVPEYQTLKPTGLLNQFQSYKVTPSFGTEFKDVNLKEWLEAPNSDDLIRELGVLISRRGVVSFRKQSDMTDDLQKQLCRRLGWLTGCPKDHDLYENPMNVVRGNDRSMQTLDIKVQAKTHKLEDRTVKQSAVEEWHTDVPGEACPAAYTVLRMTHVPECGNDTMFIDGYELYERLSKPWQKFAEGLNQKSFIKGLWRAMVENIDHPDLNMGPRGAPQNVGLLPKQIHPVVRTNPVTGWKALFHTGLFFDSIEGFTDIENREWLEKVQNLMTRNHDLQLRYRWNEAGDMAIWDNRCTLHAATIDNDLAAAVFGTRLGKRCLFAGERPFYDPKSIARSEEMQGGYA